MNRLRMAVVVACGLLLATGCRGEEEEQEEQNEEPLGPPPPVSGAFQWYADITPALSLGEDFAVAPDGRVALVSSPVRAGTVAGVPFTHFGPGTSTPNYDLLVAVLDKSGKLAWSKSFATVEIESGSSIAFDEAGDVYVAGLLKDNTDGLDFGDGITVGISPGELSGFLVKLRGTDGRALWATGIQSADRYVAPRCGSFQKEHAVRGGLGAIGCLFDAGDGTRKAKIVTRSGATEITPAGPGINSLVLAFNPASGEPTGTYVIGGANASIRALAISDSGGVVIGGQLRVGTAADSAGSEPIVVSGPSCFVASLGADLKPAYRRVFSGKADADCAVGDVALAGSGRLLVGGEAEGEVDFGDGSTTSGSFGFLGTLSADLSNAAPLERYADERVFGVATDAWGQSFIGVASEHSPLSLRYTKRDAAGAVIFESKKYVPDAGASSPYLAGRGLAVDRSGALSVFGVLRGPFSFEDGPHGASDFLHFFGARFEP